MDLEEKLEIVTRNTAEIVTKEELKELLETKTHPRAYWGFELSGFLHLGTGLVCGLKIKDLISAGFDFTVFLADWHSWINNKLGGDMSKIRKAGEYFKHGFTALGIDPNRVNYVWASDLVKDKSYWETLIKIAKNTTLQRAWRALPIMGRSMDLSDIETAWVFYPCMQAADIYALNLDVACAGLDQRKAHMLTRDAAEKLGWKKTICIHTPLLSSLGRQAAERKKEFDEDPLINAQISSKMSKSIPIGCIFIHDAPREIKMKIQKAFCPPREIEGNPILEIVKHIIFAVENVLEIKRPRKYGGIIEYNNYGEIVSDYKAGKLHPLDLKNSVAEVLIRILEPVRDYFKRHPEPLKQMMKIEITR